MNKLGLISFVKNEATFIKEFIEYNFKIFDTIHIIDDGSTDGTLEIIKSYNDIALHQTNNAFNQKGEICSEIIKTMDTDIIVPLDADEKIIHDNKVTQSTDPDLIKKYLQSLVINGHKYKVKYVYEYNPDSPEWWDINRHKKIFFPKKTFMYTDPGFHRGRTSLDKCSTFDHKYYWRGRNKDIFNTTQISYLHYHFLSKDLWLKNTQKKLEQRLGKDWQNYDNLLKYKGPSKHVVKQYLRYLKTNKWHNLKNRVKLNFI